MNEIRIFATVYGDYDIDLLLERLNSMNNADAEAAADIIGTMLPDYIAAQKKRDRIAELQEEIERLKGNL